MGVKTALFVDHGHLSAVGKEFFGRHQKIAMGRFRDWCIQSSGPDSELAIRPLLYDAESRVHPLPGDPEWPADDVTWTAEQRARRKNDNGHLENHGKFCHSITKPENGGYIVRLGRTVWRPVPGGKPGEFLPEVQKEVDTAIAVDIADLVWRHPEIRRIVLVSADSDLCAPLRFARKPGYYHHPHSFNGVERMRCESLFDNAREIVIIHGPEPKPGRYRRILEQADRTVELTCDVLSQLRL